MVKRIGRSLGKGMSHSLLTSVEEGDKFLYIQRGLLQPGKYQPRKEFDQAALENLAYSIRTSGGGVIEPIVVRTMRNGLYEIIAGERRWRAAGIIELEEVPCIVKKGLSDKEVLKISLVENVHREDLKPLEEAEAFLKLSVEFELSHAEIGELVGRSRSAVSNLLRLLDLSPECKKALSENKIEAGHARAMLALSPEGQGSVLKQCLNRKLSVRGVEKLVGSVLANGVNDSEDCGNGDDDTSDIDADLILIEQHFFRKKKSLIHIKALSGGEVTVRFKSIEVMKDILKDYL